MATHFLCLLLMKMYNFKFLLLLCKGKTLNLSSAYIFYIMGSTQPHEYI
jgi:hypothetical protein